MAEPLDPRVQMLLDKQDIYEVVTGYMRGVDRLDRVALRAAYHDDATDDRGFFRGGPDAFADFAMTVLKDHHANHHMIGQCAITVEGDVGFGEIYFQAWHRFVEDGVEKDFVVLGRYIDRYERREGQWKIAHRSELNDGTWTRPVGEDWLSATPSALRGRRGADDLSSQRETVRHL